MTRHQRLADIQPQGLCKEHEFFHFVNKDIWNKADLVSRTVMKAQATEDLRIFKAISVVLAPS